MNYPLSIITDPVPVRTLKQQAREWVARPARLYLKGRTLPAPGKYGGHSAVTRSLVEGLSKAGLPFNYNPSIKDMYSQVLVLSGVKNLENAIALKKAGKISTLLAGPNVVDHILDHGKIGADPGIDRYLVPSEWVKNVILDDAPELTGRIIVWAAGVDTGFWTPVSGAVKTHVLLYKKSESPAFHAEVKHVIEEAGYQVIEIEYGKYDDRMFRKALNRSAFAVFISRSESQGIALAEAWAMNVPTLVYNPGSFFYGGKLVEGISACPYLVDTAGKEWKTLEELNAILGTLNEPHIAPRKYTLEYFTDDAAASNLISQLALVIDSAGEKAVN